MAKACENVFKAAEIASYSWLHDQDHDKVHDEDHDHLTKVTIRSISGHT